MLRLFLAQEQIAQLFPKNELVTSYTSVSEIREKHDALKMEMVKLEAQIKQLQDSLDTLLRIQQRSVYVRVLSTYSYCATVSLAHTVDTIDIDSTHQHQRQHQQYLIIRLFCRSLESSLFNKVNELQEDISVKRYDLRIAQIQLAAVRCQVNVKF